MDEYIIEPDLTERWEIYNRRPDDAVVDHLLRLFAPRAFSME